MSAALACHRCGAKLTDSSRGICPTCVMLLGGQLPFTEVTAAAVDDTALAPTLDPTRAAPCRRSPPQPGERLGGYSIVRLLGKGGMGAVYEAEEVESGRRVAL